MNRPVDGAALARTRAFWAASKPGESAAPGRVPDAPGWWQVALALGTALIIQSALAPFIAFRGATPPLVALLVGWYALRTGPLRGFTFGLIAGAAEDALAGTTGVAWTFATAFAGLAAGRFAGTWLADTQLFLIPAAAAIVLVRYGAFLIAMQIQALPFALPLVHLHAVLWQCAFAALAAFAMRRAFPALGGARH